MFETKRGFGREEGRRGIELERLRSWRGIEQGINGKRRWKIVVSRCQGPREEGVLGSKVPHWWGVAWQDKDKTTQ